MSYIPVLEKRTRKEGTAVIEEWTGRVIRTKEIIVREETIVVPDGYLPFRLQGTSQEDVETQIKKKLAKV